ncbi:hypothetical protein HY772_05810 [Candidatus Woesearchaeota archaeon]|nr:hypothetical protein [Candidatus Woesearchaeota archaeon]
MRDNSKLWILSIIAVISIVSMVLFGMREVRVGIPVETAAGEALRMKSPRDIDMTTRERDAAALSSREFIRALAKSDLSDITNLKMLIDREKGKALTAQEVDVLKNRIDIVNAVESGYTVVAPADAPEVLIALPNVIDKALTIIQIDKEKKELTRFSIDMERHLLIERKKGDTLTNLGEGIIDAGATLLTVRRLDSGIIVTSSSAVDIDKPVVEVTNIAATNVLAAKALNGITPTSIDKSAKT